jgi:hypothetical protein
MAWQCLASPARRRLPSQPRRPQERPVPFPRTSFLSSIPRLVAWLCLTAPLGVAATPIDFHRDVRPVLSDACFRCHGPDAAARKSGLRLDLREAALLPAKSGALPLVPGHPEQSEMFRRLTAPDPTEVMPPAEVHPPLTAEQRERIRRWIAEGAEYPRHWSLVPPVRTPVPSLPASTDPTGGTTRVTHPVDAFIQEALARQGLVPSPEADRTTLIRRVTLDLTGLPPTPSEVDAFLADRTPSAYERVVDRLLTSPRYGERMAQDWLDVARYADSNGYQVDRDRELWAWRDWVIQAFNRNLPFDQFTVEQLAGDLLPNPTLDQRIATGFHRNHLVNEEGGVIAEEFLAEYCADRVETTATVWLGLTFNCARCHDHKFDPVTQRDFYSLLAFFHNVPEQGVGNYGVNIRRSTPPFLQLPTPEQATRIADLRAALAETQRRLAQVDATLLADLSDWLARDLPATPAPTPEVKAARLKPADQRNDAERKLLTEFRLGADPERAALARQAANWQSQIEAADLAIPVTLVMAERDTPRPTFILKRGAYDQPGEAVTPDSPAALPAFPAHLPRNRLGLARWLTDPRHPLTARVTVNRLWQSLFGQGLVRTPGDFGAQGEWPSHPELLDWLATEFVGSGWNVKSLVRLLVTSATYRQDSRSNPALLTADPENRWLARGPRYRLSAEAIRDQALSVAGLLAGPIGGPSVKPYHPPGLYEQVVAGSSADSYVQDHGQSLYRRTLYTYWKRSVPNPALLLFDVPFRETCTVRRSRTTTPLQALNLLNDPTYVEAARGLARRLMLHGGAQPADRIRYGFRLVTGRHPQPRELTVLVAGFQRAAASYRPDPAGAAALLAVGESGTDATLDPVEWAAYTLVASTLLNLDETVTRE